MGLLARLTGRDKGPKRDPERYKAERDIAVGGDTRARMALAESPQTHQEILYYLATHDDNVRIRQAVARNATTPMQATQILSLDRDDDVRMALAERLIKLLPDLDPGRQSQMYAFVAQALGTLALDQVLAIRRALSSALKDCANTPPKVAGQLARDIEREVAEPILRFCATLADEDLLDILKQHPADWAVQAVASRDKVSARVARAVIATADRLAGLILLRNTGAVISPDLMEEIIEKSKHYPEWQQPIAVHKALPPDMARTLAEFADVAVQDLLARRTDLDESAAKEIASLVRRRMEFEGETQGAGKETPAARAARLDKQGKLNEETLTDALGMRDRAFAVAALAQMAGVDIAAVEKILNLKAAKPIIALARRAKLSMRMALRLQQEMGQVPPKELIYPRGGTDYPFTDAELAESLDFVGLRKS